MRRSLLAIGIGTGTALAIVAACTFPDVTFNDGTGGPETGTETSTPTQEAGTDAPTDTAIPDVVMVGEAEAPIDAAACDDANCDCDGDGFFDIKKRSLACDAGADAMAYDCDDLVKSRNPGVKEFLGGPTPAGGPDPVGDWNCNQKLELAVDTNLKCKTGILDCSASTTEQNAKAGNNAQGFLTDVKCGGKALLYACSFEGANGCIPKQSGTTEQPQGCK